jgi:histidyl-tRNA synthetase
MSKKIQSIRGMHDILPKQTPAWQQFETVVKRLLAQYGYQEIRMPIVEMSELFSRAVGEVTDIVEKEMYTFDDRNGDSLTLRPEGTAGCVRAGIEHGLLHNQQQRLWYMGSMFRHERPQKGRYRQFHQIGLETFGIETPDIDAELIAFGARLWKALGLKNIRLELNTLGTPESRQVHRDLLIEYFSANMDLLDEEAKSRLHSNPLRILDTKNPDMQELVENAPKLFDHLDQASKEHFERLQQLLGALGIEYRINPRLVRGLDYYTRTVFEWVTDQLGAQGTVCAGGRYDGLVSQLGGKVTPACGFAMGIERLLALMEEQGVSMDTPKPDVYFVTFGADAEEKGIYLAETLREAMPSLQLINNCGAGSFKSQMKRADKSGAKFALILGENELKESSIALKSLRTNDEQEMVAFDQLTDVLKNKLKL